MTKLECSVKNCLHNADNCCCKAAIAVDGNKAKTAEQTCCCLLYTSPSPRDCS